MARNDFDNDRSPEEIERELEQTRQQITRTIDAIQYKITPGQLFQDAYGYARGGSTDFIKNLGTAAKNNPVPVALVGIGLAWLATSGGRTPSYLRGGREPDYNRGASVGESASTAGDYARTAGTYARSGGEYAAEAGRTAAHAAGEAGKGAYRAGQGAAAAAGSMGRGIRDMASGASHRVREMADDVRDLASEWTESTAGFTEKTRERMHGAGETIQERTMQMRDNANYLLREQPLVIGALGLAVGAVIGALLPITRRENELMGETRDQLLHQATELGEQALDQATDAAKNVASAASEAVQSEAEKHGLTGEGTKHGAEDRDTRATAQPGLSQPSTPR